MLKLPKLHSGLSVIDAQWEQLCTVIQKYIEHHPFTNAELGAIAKGDIVRSNEVGGARLIVRALADTSAHAEWIGVCDGSPVVAAGAKTDVALSNVQLVRFEDGIIGLTEGVPCYLSGATSGAATPVDNAAFSTRVGIIVDASPYVSVTNHFAWVLLGKCCTPSEVNPG